MKDYPQTFLAAREGKNEGRPKIFDPALNQFPNAFRLGIPNFESDEQRARWFQTRAVVRSHLLRFLASSQWHQNLVLRGSLLMRAWFGEDAREPGDADFVFRPQNVALDSSKSAQFFKEFRDFAVRCRNLGEVEILTERVATDDIWTYVRAAGRRIVFPFRAPGLPPGEVQFDIVFGEELFAEPIVTEIEPGLHFWSATKELSLAWKLLWLITDMHPQRKDFYDAMILAENVAPARELLDRVLNDSYLGKQKWDLSDLLSECIGVGSTDCFAEDNPDAEKLEGECRVRLAAALEKNFSLPRLFPEI